jgi:outer membrane protein assembly factor BamD
MTTIRSLLNRSVAVRAATLLALTGTLLLGACGTRRGPAVAPTADELYRRGVEAYEAGRHARAAEHLSAFVLSHLGDPRVPEAQYLLGRAHMARREFISAVGEFHRLVNDYPTHARGQDARYRMCESYYRLSPRPQLDQEYTRTAILHCEAFATYYPQTAEAGQARTWVAELNDRLARKVYDNGVFYFRRRAFDAAVIYFNETVENYPQSSVAPAALHMLAEAYSRIGYVEDAEAARERLLRDYPESAEARALRG